MSKPVSRKSLSLCVLLLPIAAFGEPESQLMQFEADATEPPEDAYSGQRHRRHQEQRSQSYAVGLADEKEPDHKPLSALENEITQGILDIAYYAVTTPGMYSWNRVTQGPYGTDNQRTATPRKPGDRLIPFARVDMSYNRVDSDIYALGRSAEVGYGPFGFTIRAARYRESEPATTLDVTQYHWLYRMSLGDRVEMDLGLGRYKLSGVSEHSGGSSTIRLLINASDHVGIELRPSWADINGNGIRDHEAAMTFGDKYWSALAGYHWLEGPGSSLNGPVLGLSLRF